MRYSDLVVGEVYVVEGRGPMRLEGKEPEPWLTLRFRSHGPATANLEHWATPEEVERLCPPVWLVPLLPRQDVPQGLRCQDTDCWCGGAAS